MQSNKTYILYVVFFFHMKTSRQNCRPVCLVTERAQACDTSGMEWNDMSKGKWDVRSRFECGTA